VDGRDAGWYGLGQVSVCPERQRRGIGSAVIRDGLARLRRFSFDQRYGLCLSRPGWI